MNRVFLIGLIFILCPILADTIISNDLSSVVRKSEVCEMICQTPTWTSEDIAKNPYLFLQDQIARCEKLHSKIEHQNVALIRMEKKASRALADARSMQNRYQMYLNDAKAAYKTANGNWPVTVNGYELKEEEFYYKIADAIERVELAKKEYKDNSFIVEQALIRKRVLRGRKCDVVNLRMKLVQQAEQVKMNATLAEIGDLKDLLKTITVIMHEIDRVSTKMPIVDMEIEDPNVELKNKVNSFLN